MRRPIVVPELGIPVALVSVWYARPGERLYAGDRVVELLMDTVTFDVAAPCTGILVERAAWADDTVTPGNILGYIEEDSESCPYR